MRRPKVQQVFAWARYELEKRGAVLIFTARYIPWGRVAVNYVAGTTGFPHRSFFFLDAFACVTWVVLLDRDRPAGQLLPLAAQQPAAERRHRRRLRDRPGRRR